MVADRNELLETLREIRDLLVPISAGFEEQYLETQRRKLGSKLGKFEETLTATRKDIFPLLFDPRRLSQAQIAELAHTSQPTVSRFVAALVKEALIEQIEEEAGTVYRDKYGLAKLLQK